jgi:acyl-coenzyme A thioesterase PaaI-like protein
MSWHIISPRSGPMFRLLCAVAATTHVVAFNHQLPDSLSRIQCESRNASATGVEMRNTAADEFSVGVSRNGSRVPSLGRSDPLQQEMSSYDRMVIPARGELSGHAIFGTLLGENLIEKYEIWKQGTKRDNDDVTVSFVTFGSSLNGHPGIVHGGILSLIFDDMFGFAYEALGVTHAVTANLNIDYRAPVPQNTKVRIAVQLSTRDGRKLYWKAQMTSADQQILYAEATSLYVIPKSTS